MGTCIRKHAVVEPINHARSTSLPHRDSVKKEKRINAKNDTEVTFAKEEVVGKVENRKAAPKLSRSSIDSPDPADLDFTKTISSDLEFQSTPRFSRHVSVIPSVLSINEVAENELCEHLPDVPSYADDKLSLETSDELSMRSPKPDMESVKSVKSVKSAKK